MIRSFGGLLHQQRNTTHSTGRAMNDVKRFSALTPTVPPFVDGTPPERQIPLTPPATDERQQSTSDLQSPVSKVLGFIRQRQLYNLTGESRQWKVTPLEHSNLWVRLEELPDLKRFASDKLRYVTIWIALPVANST
mgnify:CR=1 FL=1